MNEEKQKSKNLPKAGLRLLSLLPVFNWISLIYIGIRYSSTINVIFGVLYGVLTFTIPSLAVYLWLIVIIQYAVVYRKIKKTIDTQHIPGPQDAALRKIDQPFVDTHSKDGKPVEQTAKEKIQSLSKVNDASSAIGYTDVVLPGSQEKTQTIPLKPTVSGVSKDTADFNLEESYSGYSSNSKFMKDMKKFADRSATKAPFVPFIHHWPTYDSMSSQQKAWYFYWRTEVRSKNYPNTDLSYIFVHVYELLSGCGWQDAQNGLDQLMALWMAYRERFPKLDFYLFDWTFDFAQLYKLKYLTPDIADIPLPRQSAVKDLLIDQHSEDRPLKLPFAMIDALCDYSLVNSKFYKDGHQLLMQEAIPRIVALADAALLKKINRGILAVYGPNHTEKQSYYVFQSAVCPNANKRIDISVKAYTSSLNLRSYMNELVRYGENALRSLYGYRGRLHGVTLDEETANLVDTFLKREYAPTRKAANTPAQKVEVKLDFDSIDALRVQSDAVRDALDVPEDADYTYGSSPETANPIELVSTEEFCHFERSVLSVQMQQFFDALTPVQIETLYIILSQEEPLSKLEQIAEEAMTMPEILIDEINDAATQFLDDILLDALGDAPRILEQYEPELKKALK